MSIINKNIKIDLDNNYDYNHLFKLIIIGDSGVGKTNIITRYAKNEFRLNLKATIGVEFCTKLIEINEDIIKIQLWDTAGQERFRSLTSTYYKGSHGILVVYDITNCDSFSHVSKWIQEIYNNVGNDIPILLIGNKLDLEDKRIISSEKLIEIAKIYNLEFIEMSAMNCTNVQSGIDKLIKNIYDLQYKKNMNNAKTNIYYDESYLKNKMNKSNNKCC